ncbi:MAG: phage holin family protein [Chlorobiaceae bacterium]
MMSPQKGENLGPTQGKQKYSRYHQLFDDTATSTYNDVMSIIDAKIELLKIEVTERISLVGSAVILSVILIIGIGYLLTTVALLTGELFGHPFLGYLLVSLVFLFCFLFFTKFKPFLLKNLIQKFLLSLHDYNK